MRNIIFLILTLFPVITFAELQIDNAWIKNLPPTVPVRAGYMEIHNPGTEAISIVAFSSDAFSSIDAHITVMKNGMMNMEHLSEITVEPGTSLMLEPGGMHLMMHPLKPTTAGETIQVQLEMSDGSQQTLQFSVRP
jgi:hypothetical protein